MKQFYKKTLRWRKTLQKASVFAILAAGGLTTANAQVSSYTFAQSVSTYTHITGGTVLGTATGNTSATNLNSEVYAVTLPFSFNFNGKLHTSINVSSNGFITFGSTAPTATLTTPISSTVAYDGAVAAFGGDLSSFSDSGIAGEIRWETVGTAPNREVVVQWANFRPNSSTSTTAIYSFGFQIRLKENNDIQTTYNAGTLIAGSSAISGTRQIGLRGATNSDFNNRLNTSTTAFDNSAPGTAASSSQAWNTVNNPPGMPPAGLTYTWTSPSCFTVSDLASTAVTTNSGTITFTVPTPVPANGYEIYYSTSPTDPTSTTVLNGTNSTTTTGNTVTITGLTAGTQYYFWVRAKCSGTATSAWSSSGSFITTCVAITAPYSENFDTTPTGSSTNMTVPACWSYLETAGSAGYGYVSTTTPASAPNNFYMYNSTATTGDMMLVSPQTTNLTDGNRRVRFSARSSTTNMTVEVGTLSNPADPTTFVIIGSPVTLTSTYTEYIVNIPTGTNQYLAFRHGLGGTYRNLYLDDIFVENIPTCFEPANLTVSAQTDSSGTLTWTPPTMGGAPQSYTLYYSTLSTPPNASTTLTSSNSVTVAGTTGTISGLTPSTTYFVWIRSNCSPTDSSVWTQAAVTFTTNCLPPNVTATGQTVCSGYSATLTATSTTPGANFEWFDAATGGTSLGTGASYTTPVLNATTNYWVTASSITNGTVGPVSPSSLGTVSATNYPITTYYQIFDVVQPTTLSSIDVFPVSSVAIGTSASIEIRDSTGAVLVNVPYTVSVNDGVTPQTVVLNYPLPVGTGYRIGQGAPAINLNRNTSGAVYPYTSGIINITGNNFSSGAAYWYYIYNWKFTEGCASARTLVTATVNTDPNCSMATVETDGKDSVMLYPNPFTDVINIANIKDVSSVAITDMAGRTVKVFAKPMEQLSVAELRTGMYLVILKMKDGSMKTVKAIKK